MTGNCFSQGQEQEDQERLSLSLSSCPECRNGEREARHTAEGCHSKTTCNDRTLKTFLVYVIATFSPTKLHSSLDKDAAAMYFLNFSFQIRNRMYNYKKLDAPPAAQREHCSHQEQDFRPGACALCAVRRVWWPPSL